MLDFQTACQELKDQIELLLNHDSDDLLAYFEHSVEDAITCSVGIQKIGNVCHKALMNNDLADKDKYVYTAVHFEWMDKAKTYLILWRDILFQQYKGLVLLENEDFENKYKAKKIYELDKEKTASSNHQSTVAATLNAYNAESKTIIQKASESLIALLDQFLVEYNTNTQKANKQLTKWKLQTNPWLTYEKQLSGLANQFQIIASKQLELREAAGVIETITHQIRTTLQNSINKIQRKHKLIVRIRNYINEEIQKVSINNLFNIIDRLEEGETEIQPTHHSSIFSNDLEIHLAKLSKEIEFPIKTESGKIIYTEVNLKRRTKNWIEAEIMPLLYEVWELTENVVNGARMSLVNIKNRTTLLSANLKEDETLEIDKISLTPPLDIFEKKILKVENEFNEIEKIIDKRLNTEFRLSLMYEAGQEFLPVRLENSISQIQINPGQIERRVKKWYTDILNIVNGYKLKIKKEEALSLSEKVVRYVDGRKSDVQNSYYTNIFLTKGYVGESFWVGRNENVSRTATLIQNWKIGFRGSVLITGERHSGKSLFGELIANKYFANQTIRLTPDSILNLNGKKIKIGHNIQVALKVIQREMLDSGALIWIDDLETWWSLKTPLNENIRNLSYFIDAHANKLFFMVSIGNGLKKHLNNYHEIDKVFQAEINLNKMNFKDVEEAIMIRHGATHKILVNEKNEVATPQYFNRVVKRIYKASEGNIGEALNLWAYSIRKVNETEVNSHYKKPYNLPNFLNPDVGILLSTIMLHKRTNEARLRKTFGPNYTLKYNNILLRLIGIGVVVRTLDDWLEVNDVVVAKIEDMLVRHKYL